MVTLSVTRSRVAGVLRGAADLAGCCGWDPARDRSLVALIDQAIGLIPGKGSPDAEETSIAAWAALAEHLGVDIDTVDFPREWEQQPGRTADEVRAALYGAAQALMTHPNADYLSMLRRGAHDDLTVRAAEMQRIAEAVTGLEAP